MNCVYTFAYETRNILAALPLVYAFVSTRRESEYDLGIWSIATVLCLAGSLLRGWARCHCNFARRRKKVLATTGPYALSRNPLYVGNMLVIVGAGVASGIEWFLPFLLLWTFAVYNLAIKHEEGTLVEKYGEEYVAYRSKVRAWFSLGPLSKRDLSAPEFLQVASLQATYGFALLVPFLIKELDPISLWPRP